MGWTVTQTSGTYDYDLVFEVPGNDSLDGSGNYDTGWLATNDVDRVRIVGQGVGSAYVAVDQSHTNSGVYSTAPAQVLTVLGGQSGGVFSGEADLTARYFRVVMSGGTANATLRMAIRAIKRV